MHSYRNFMRSITGFLCSLSKLHLMIYNVWLKHLIYLFYSSECSMIVLDAHINIIFDTNKLLSTFEYSLNYRRMLAAVLSVVLNISIYFFSLNLGVGNPTLCYFARQIDQLYYFQSSFSFDWFLHFRALPTLAFVKKKLIAEWGSFSRRNTLLSFI